MKSKKLREILATTLEVSSKEDLVGLLQSAKSGETLEHVQDGLLSAIDAFDVALMDLERLSMSPTALAALNDQIYEQAEKQKNALDQLQATIKLLSAQSENESRETDGDLSDLVTNVAQLVMNQMNMNQDLKSIFEEGLHISSALSFKSLESQLESSIEAFAGDAVKVKMYFAGHLFGKSDPSAFFACNIENQPVERLDLKTMTITDNIQFQTVNSTKGHGILAFARIECRAGADPSALLTRIQPLFPSVASTLENIKLMWDEKRKQHLESELQVAHFVQKALLPATTSKIIDKCLEISGYYQSASECGGDWWSHMQMADGRHVLFVGDVTGHGTGSALICALVKGYCESFCDRRDLAVGTMLSELNRVIARVSRDSGRAMTMTVAAIDLQAQKLTIANAGHPPPILIHSGGSLQHLLGSGFVLGTKAEAHYSERAYPFKAGDWLFMYSDGVIEYINRNREMFGSQRLERFLKSTKTNSGAELNRILIRELREFSLGQDLADDVTTVVVRYF